MSTHFDPVFWQGKRVLVTGHTGFKGAWLTHMLTRIGADVTGVSLAPSTDPSLFELLDLRRRCRSVEADITDGEATSRVVQEAKPEVVFHLAAQALVRTGYEQPLRTFSTNVMGTAHVLNALRGQNDVRVVVAITTDKVYRNREWLWPYRETDALGGYDPYSASKAATEAVIECWKLSYLSAQGVAVASARAGNVIGGGDWAEHRLIPDLVRSWSHGQTADIRRPQSVRPWQHVIEPLAAYMSLARRLWNEPQLAQAYNFGPPASDALTVREVVNLARQRWGAGNVRFGDGIEGPHEAGLLSLDTSLAARVLGISPRWNTETAVLRAIDWYQNLSKGVPAADLCNHDLDVWEEHA